MSFVHAPVLLQEVVEALQPAAGRRYIDGTLGGGGHSEALLQAGAEVWGFDRDPDAGAAACARLAPFADRFHFVAAPFSTLLARGPGPVDGILLDLGVSSPQLDRAERGFSFMQQEPLDMRMSRTGQTAAELIESLDEATLAEAIERLGEERQARRIARALKVMRPQSTRDAVAAIEQAVPRKLWPTRIHVATRTFQALRMLVNQELDELTAALEAIPQLLKPGGRAAIISFHSLEDRPVKQAFQRLSTPPDEGDPLRLLPTAARPPAAFRKVTAHAIQASDEEMARNPRARSARLRVLERCP